LTVKREPSQGKRPEERGLSSSGVGGAENINIMIATLGLETGRWDPADQVLAKG